MNTFTSVITLTHNQIEYTKRCLSSLLQTTYSPWELIVVDNGSTDGTRDWLEAFKRTCETSGVKVSIILNDGNIGCSTARNQGVEKARGKRLVFIDNDIALRSRNWLTGLGECLDNNKAACIVGPKLVYTFEPYAIQFAGGAVSRSGRVQFIGRGEARDNARFNKKREVQCFISACFMVRRPVLEQVGGFDEAFNPVEYEDIDLCYRVRSKGHKIIYLPSVEMYHFESVTTTGTPALPNTYLIIKHGLLFKKRWKHMFEKENGPPDEETKWRNIQTRDLASVGELPVLE